MNNKDYLLQLYKELQKEKYDPNFKHTKDTLALEKLVEKNYIRYYKIKNKLKKM